MNVRIGSFTCFIASIDAKVIFFQFLQFVKLLLMPSSMVDRIKTKIKNERFYTEVNIYIFILYKFMNMKEHLISSVLCFSNTVITKVILILCTGFLLVEFNIPWLFFDPNPIFHEYFYSVPAASQHLLNTKIRVPF